MHYQFLLTMVLRGAPLLKLKIIRFVSWPAYGHFVCACSTGSLPMSVSADVRLLSANARFSRHFARSKSRERIIMAVFAAKLFFVFQCMLLLFLNTEGVQRSKDGCFVCGRKSQETRFRSASPYAEDLENCFGGNLRLSASSTADICEGCRRALQEHRRTGQTFHHVSFETSFFVYIYPFVSFSTSFPGNKVASFSV